MTEMSWASIISETTCRTAEIKCEDKSNKLKWIVGVHVLPVTRPQGGVVQTPDIWSIQVIKEDRVHNLLHGDAPNILGG